MLYHPYLLVIAMVLFLYSALEGYAVAKGKREREESRHRYGIYPAFVIFVLAMISYYGFEKEAVSSAQARESFEASGFLTLHAITIGLSSILLVLSFLLGLAGRDDLFQGEIKRGEIAHMSLGSLGIASYVVAVFTGTAMYLRAGLL